MFGVENQIPFYAVRYHRGHKQDSGPPLFVPEVSKRAACTLIFAIPSRKIFGVNLLDGHARWNADINPRVCARDAGPARVHEHFEQCARIRFSGVDRHSSTRCPARAFEIGSRSIEKRMASVGNAERVKRAVRPGGHRKFCPAIPPPGERQVPSWRIR